MSKVLSLLDSVIVVLVSPKYPENIGSAARIALNMGVTQLRVVCENQPDESRMLPCATHNAREIIATIGYYPDLPAALEGVAVAVGTTARIGRKRRTVTKPREVARQIVPLLQENRVALVFGSESRGLTNDEVNCCSLLTTIPTANFSSINLAQAVALICYELYGAVQEANQKGGAYVFTPRLATIVEQERMHEDMNVVLNRLDLLNETKQSVLRSAKVRKFFGRLSLKAKETRLVSGYCRRILQALERGDLSGR